jgi:hypothetical protein
LLLLLLLQLLPLCQHMALFLRTVVFTGSTLENLRSAMLSCFTLCSCTGQWTYCWIHTHLLDNGCTFQSCRTLNIAMLATLPYGN